MKITALEIRQKAFETHFRGYDKDEVDAFLLSLSQEWERVGNNLREQDFRLDSTSKELEKLREVENSLFKTLKTAEDTSQSMIEQANKSAQLQLRETQMNTEALLNDARVLAKDMIDEAEAAIKNSYELMKDQIRLLEQEYKSLENHRDSVLGELKNLAASVEEKVERAEKQKVSLDKKAFPKPDTDIKAALEPLDNAFEKIVRTKEKSSSKPSEIEWTVSNNELDSPISDVPKTPDNQDIPGESFFDQ